MPINEAENAVMQAEQAVVKIENKIKLTAKDSALAVERAAENLEYNLPKGWIAVCVVGFLILAFGSALDGIVILTVGGSVLAVKYQNTKTTQSVIQTAINNYKAAVNGR